MIARVKMRRHDDVPMSHGRNQANAGLYRLLDGLEVEIQTETMELGRGFPGEGMSNDCMNARWWILTDKSCKDLSLIIGKPIYGFRICEHELELD